VSCTAQSFLCTGVGRKTGIDLGRPIGENLGVARKEPRRDNELAGGTLSHNPFGCLPGAGSERPPTPAPEVPNPRRGLAKIVVRFEAKGHGGKRVTRISGLDLTPEELEALAHRLKRALGSGARLEHGDVLVQGQLVSRVTQWLQAQGHEHVGRGN